MEFTGERFVPGVRGEIELERLHRFLTGRSIRLFHVIKHHAVLSKVVRRVPERHQQTIQTFLLNAQSRFRRPAGGVEGGRMAASRFSKARRK